VLSIITDELSIFRQTYQQGLVSLNITSSIQGVNEINITSAGGSVTIPGSLVDSIQQGSPQQIKYQIVGGDGPTVTDITVTTNGAADGQEMLLLLQQNLAGNGTWPDTIGNVLLPGGTFTKSLGANATDAFVLKFQSLIGGGAWIATSIALDVK
jgi:hypothetical protein